MKKPAIPIFCMGILLLLCACGFRPDASPPPRTEAPAAAEAEPAPEPEPAPLPVEKGPSFVEGLALERAAALAETEGEPAIRAAYRWLVSNVYFADPVGLDTWRYLSDEEEAIPYLENRALSPFLFGIGSCEDFAAAMVMLARARGFEAEYVAGYTLSVEQVYVDHAWAVVKLDGGWYHLDPQLEQNVTRGGRLTWRYYLRSDEEMLTDHKWGENLIDFWDEMPGDEKAAIRREYTPPLCPESRSRPEEENVPRPMVPNMAEVEARIADIIAGSGRGKLPYLPLNVEPPVLVAAKHVTPLLLPGPEAAEPAPYRRGLLDSEAAKLYDELATAAEWYPDIGAIPLPEAVDNATAARVAEALLADRPELYWLKITPTGEGAARQLKLSASNPPEEIARQAAQVEAEAERLLAAIAGASDFEKALYIHDYLAGGVRYDTATTRRNSDNIYGALVEGVAYCNGYAGAFQYLAARAGVETAYLTGTSTRGVAHAWNAVRLDGEWHYVDATWDRHLKAGDGVYHDYFLIGEGEMRRDRRPDDENLLPPPRSDSAPGYYERLGYAVGANTDAAGADPAEAMAAAFLRQLKAESSFPAAPAPVFLELKVLGDAGNYDRWKEHYVKQVFQILRQMEEGAREEQLPFTISGDTTVRCDFNDTMQVLTFYPKVSLMEE